MNKILRFTAVILVICTLLAVPVFAISTDDIQPLFDNIDFVSTVFTINSLGKATCMGNVAAVDESTVKVVCFLQRYENGIWVTLERWEHTATRYARVTNVRYVARGYQYRTMVFGYLYDDDGNIAESGRASYKVDYF